ncbi:hypothetical protein J1N35_032789 [Gossypium stocksii]|uniref:RRM domain-containing protein n=1 Tax=Gossypium stocksii TaxID=47602 RepID=A0A9D3V469_9ROSI|nr:hypothetical protein J1N35_032789 [Gossypium stocksii]
MTAGLYHPFVFIGVRLPEDLRGPFGQFGHLKDVYLPRNYYTGQPRGFGFVQYLDPADVADAKYQTDGYVLLGRELTVVFAEENMKKPSEMRARERRRWGNTPLDEAWMCGNKNLIKLLEDAKSTRLSELPHYSKEFTGIAEPM